MRVLMCSSLFHPFIGGSERQAQGLARALVRRGHAVSVLTQRFPHLPAAEVVDGIPISRSIRALGVGPLYRLTYLLSSMLSLLRQRHRYQIVHVHHLYLDAFAAGLVGRALRTPVLAKVACGGDVGDLARLKRTLLHPLFFAAARRLDRVVAISGQIYGELLDHGFAPERIARIPNAVDTDRHQPPADRAAAKRALGLAGRLVTFAGRLDPQKGLTTLLEAWERVAVEDRKATLLLLGKGPQEAGLRALAERLRITARVRFAGEQGDIRPYLEASDIFVLPSVAEGMSNGLLEAMATGLPCVATGVGGSADLLTEGVNGLLVPPRAPSSLAAALLRLLRDPGLAATLGAAARWTVEEGYAIEQIATRYLTLYQEMLDAARP